VASLVCDPRDGSGCALAWASQRLRF